MLRFRKQPFSTTAVKLNKPNYSQTLHLPKTNFCSKLPQGELQQSLINQTSQELYSWQLTHNSKNKPFVIHDGPPYANGDLHLGHALNKICKDIINRFQLIYNKCLIKYQPGWDCHGLPIEMKVNPHSNIRDPLEIRKACRDLANVMIDRQRDQFIQYAIMTDFTTPYITMDHSFEINQLKVFRKLMYRGLLSRQLKPVWWGCDTNTALAEAELEYNDNHTSVAIHMKFPVVSEYLYEYVKNKGINVDSGKIQLLIWTSTPWTIPANKAVCVNEHFIYTLITNSQEYLVVAKPLVEQILSLNPQYSLTDIEIPGSILIGNTYINPSSKSSQTFPVLHGDHVVDNAGTGLVHNAPAHGREDYLVAKKYDLTIESIVDSQGKLINHMLAPGFQSLTGLKVTDPKTNVLCSNILYENNMLFHINKKFKHSYPYDWRSKTPVVQRATPQWFVNVDKIKPLALQAIDKVKFIPESGKHRLSSFIENRSEWCISRQRVWGVPLPLIYHKQTGEHILDLKIVDYIIEKLDEQGTDQWFVEEQNISRWLPTEQECTELGIQYINGADYYKGKDTMDVWFDSGTSWSTLDSEEPADIYLEGSDQHRGWFQSSLLNKVICSNTAPFKSVITHGFITDGKGQKMSKSLGNVFSPQEAIEGCKKPRTPYLGPDGLRTWVASSNFKSDVNFSPEVLNRVSEVSKKYRVTFKYLLGNLVDFHNNYIKYEQLSDLDKFTLHSLYKLQQECIEFYKEYNFPRVINAINLHVNSILSAVYFDISKDCLYTDKKDSHRRRSIQNVLDVILRTYIGLLAPIQPLSIQEVWNEYQTIANIESDSPFKVSWNEMYQLSEKYNNPELNAEFSQFFQLRDETFKLMEIIKTQSELKNKLQYEIILTVNPISNIYNFLIRNQSYLDDFFLVSNVIVKQGVPKVTNNYMTIWNNEVGIHICPSSQHKCPRCWKFTAPKQDHLCNKCSNVLQPL